jgi:succinate dehydrogenase/fumarate reductase flavoprotein subunit
VATWQEYLKAEGRPPKWPYPIRLGEEREVETDVLVLGGGIAGCWAAISAARNGVKVAIMEKADIRRSGAGGPGCVHWCNVPKNPHSRVDADQWAVQEMDSLGNYSNGIAIEIECRESYDTLLEMEQMGGKIRDTDDEYLGVEGRQDDTKFMVCSRYSANNSIVLRKDWQEPGFNPPEERNNTVLHVWGTTFKPALRRECERLGVEMYERFMATSLLNENGRQGGRVVGATGVNTRTGEFLIVKAKAVILATGGANDTLWMLDTEHGGLSFSSRNVSSANFDLAWRAGATLTMMEGSSPTTDGAGLGHKWYTGAGDADYENMYLVDADNKVLPAPPHGWADGGALFPANRDVVKRIRDGIEAGEFQLPIYGDSAGMKPEEAHATWDLTLSEESGGRAMVKSMRESGFDPGRDQILNYTYMELQPTEQFRNGRGAGVLVDWDLKTTLEGLYAAGTSAFFCGDHSCHALCASNGRYAGRKAAAYVKGAEARSLCREQIDREKARVLAPAQREEGIDWKELHFALNRIMQYYVGGYRSERLFDLALEEIRQLEEYAVPRLCAPDPHKLMRSLEDLSLIQHAKIAIQAMKERRLTARELCVQRLDYPESDPEELKNYLLLRQEDGETKFSRLPIRFWGNMKEEYEKHNPDYAGVYKPENGDGRE